MSLNLIDFLITNLISILLLVGAINYSCHQLIFLNKIVKTQEACAQKRYLINKINTCIKEDGNQLTTFDNYFIINECEFKYNKHDIQIKNPNSISSANFITIAKDLTYSYECKLNHNEDISSIITIFSRYCGEIKIG